MTICACDKCDGQKFKREGDSVLCCDCRTPVTNGMTTVDLNFYDLTPKELERIVFYDEAREKNTTSPWTSGTKRAGEYVLTYLTRLGVECRYALPHFMNELIERQRQLSADQARLVMRRALGI